MRPRRLDEFVGQEHLLGRGLGAAGLARGGRAALDGPLRAARAPGKTTLARLAAEHADAAFEELSAVKAGRRRGARGDRAGDASAGAAAAATIFFLDEIHRFNKAQQDALLPGGRGGPGHADRRDDGEPVLRGQLRAALARAGLRAARARPPRTSRRCCGGRWSAARARASRSPTRSSTFLAARAGGDARTALNALELALRRPPRARRAAVTLGDAEDAMQRKARALRQGRRPALRLHLGLDQVDARLGPGRLALLPRGDGRGRRGPALHRPADDHPRLRGHRQRRPAGAAGRGRRRARGRARRPAGGGVRARPGRDLPLAGAEVRRRQARAGRRPRPHPRVTAPSRRPPRCSRPPTRRRASSAAAKGYDYPHDAPGPLQRAGAPAGRARGRCASTTRTTASRSCASGWRRSGRRGAGRNSRPGRRPARNSAGRAAARPQPPRAGAACDVGHTGAPPSGR